MKKKFLLGNKNLEFFFFEIKQMTKPSLKKIEFKSKYTVNNRK